MTQNNAPCIIDEDGGVCGRDDCPRCGARPLANAPQPERADGTTDAPRCERCGHPLHRHRDLTLCHECEALESAAVAIAEGRGSHVPR